MALILADRVLETCTSPGTGTVTLLGAVTGYQSFSSGVGNGNTCYYAIADQSGANWEVGIGTYSSSGNTLARTTIFSSSNAGSTVNFATGTQNVYVTYPAEQAVYSNGVNIVGPSSVPLIATSGGTGQTTYTAGDILYASSSSVLTKLGIGSSGYVLSSSGSAPTWLNGVLSSDVGSAPNQIPLNQYLGKLAFMDVLNTISNNPYYDTAISDVQPTLNLDFANAKTLDSRITFSRPTTATYYDAKTSAIAEQNLVLYSQLIGGTSWNLNAGAVTASTNAVTAPDGTTTASTITAAGGTVQHAVNPIISQPAVVGYQTLSVYAQAGTNNYIQLMFGVDGNAYANFTLTGAGTVGTVGSAATATITQVGSSTWYRCTITTQSATASGFYFLVVTSGTAARYESNSLTTSVNLWGAQLEQRSSVTAYNATTTAAITNYIPVLQTAATNAARFDYNPVTRESLGLLIEEQRTNLLTYSADFSNAAWAKSNTTVTSSTIIAPDGTLTGNKIVATSATTTHTIGETITVTSGATYTLSAFYKAGEETTASLAISSSPFPRAKFDLSAGTVLSSTGTSATITSVGNSWYRCSLVFVAPTTSIPCFLAIRDIDANWAGNGFGGIYSWGAQLEAGVFATSYIPTVASQVTRSADSASMTGANFSSWYNQAEGTFMYNATVPVGGSSAQPNYVVGLGNATDNDKFSNMGNYQLRRNYVCPSLNEIGQTYLQKQLVSAFAFSTTQNLVSAALSGVLLNNNSALTSFVTNGISEYGILGIGNNGRLASAIPATMTIKKIQYYPTRLTNAELQEMTL
jgi:hypothetical protein